MWDPSSGWEHVRLIQSYGRLPVCLVSLSRNSCRRMFSDDPSRYTCFVASVRSPQFCRRALGNQGRSWRIVNATSSRKRPHWHALSMRVIRTARVSRWRLFSRYRNRKQRVLQSLGPWVRRLRYMISSNRSGQCDSCEEALVYQMTPMCFVRRSIGSTKW